jgi:hypothetical protein
MLKRAYRGSVVIHRRTDISLDLDTGAKIITTEAWQVDKAIILPSGKSREFSFDLAFIAVLKQFTYGASYDTDTRRIIIDNADLPAGWKPRKDDYVVYDNLKYEINEIQEFEFNAGIIYTLKALIGQETDLIRPVLWRSTMHLHDSFAGEAVDGYLMRFMSALEFQDEFTSELEV